MDKKGIFEQELNHSDLLVSYMHRKKLDERAVHNINTKIEENS